MVTNYLFLVVAVDISGGAFGGIGVIMAGFQVPCQGVPGGITVIMQFSPLAFIACDEDSVIGGVDCRGFPFLVSHNLSNERLGNSGLGDLVAGKGG